MPRTLGTQSSVPNLPALPSSPQIGDECIVGGVEYVCLTAGTWTLRSTASTPAWESPTLVSGWTYALSGPANAYVIFLGSLAVLEPGVDYIASGTQFTIISNLARSIVNSGGLLRAVRMSSAVQLPSGFYLDARPQSAHSNDLEFDTTAGLTAWSPSGNYSVELINSGVAVQCNSAPAGVDWGGAYFALPSGSIWTMFVKTGIAPGIPSPITDMRTVHWGVALLQNTSNSSELITLASGWTGGDASNGRNTHIFCSRWSNHSTLNTEYAAVYYGAHDEMASYFRITRNGSAYSYWFSRNGLYWTPLFSHTPPWIPAVGAILYCNGANRAQLGSAAHFYHVRFTNSASVNQAYPARRI